MRSRSRGSARPMGSIPTEPDDLASPISGTVSADNIETFAAARVQGHLPKRLTAKALPWAAIIAAIMALIPMICPDPQPTPESRRSICQRGSFRVKRQICSALQARGIHIQDSQDIAEAALAAGAEAPDDEWLAWIENEE